MAKKKKKENKNCSREILHVAISTKYLRNRCTQGIDNFQHTQIYECKFE